MCQAASDVQVIWQLKESADLPRAGKESMQKINLIVGAALLFGPTAQRGQQPVHDVTHTLKAMPKTVAWGYYDAKTAPVLCLSIR